MSNVNQFVILENAPSMTRPHSVSSITSQRSIQKLASIFGWALILTGIFAAVGALYRWGEGPLFLSSKSENIVLYVAELIIAAPISIIAGIGYFHLKRWGLLAGFFSIGVYMYGSVLLYAKLFFSNGPLPIQLIIPPIFGIGLSICLIIWSWRHFDEFT